MSNRHPCRLYTTPTTCRSQANRCGWSTTDKQCHYAQGKSALEYEYKRAVTYTYSPRVTDMPCYRVLIIDLLDYLATRHNIGGFTDQIIAEILGVLDTMPQTTDHMMWFIEIYYTCVYKQPPDAAYMSHLVHCLRAQGMSVDIKRRVLGRINTAPRRRSGSTSVSNFLRLLLASMATVSTAGPSPAPSINRTTIDCLEIYMTKDEEPSPTECAMFVSNEMDDWVEEVRDKDDHQRQIWDYLRRTEYVGTRAGMISRAIVSRLVDVSVHMLEDGVTLRRPTSTGVLRTVLGQALAIWIYVGIFMVFQEMLYPLCLDFMPPPLFGTLQFFRLLKGTYHALRSRDCTQCQTLFHPVERSEECDGCRDVVTDEIIKPGQGMCMQTAQEKNGKCMSITSVAALPNDKDPFTQLSLDDRFDSIRPMLVDIQPFSLKMTTYMPSTVRYMTKLIAHVQAKKSIPEKIQACITLLYIMWYRPVDSILGLGLHEVATRTCCNRTKFVEGLLEVGEFDWQYFDDSCKELRQLITKFDPINDTYLRAMCDADADELKNLLNGIRDDALWDSSLEWSDQS